MTFNVKATLLPVILATSIIATEAYTPSPANAKPLATQPTPESVVADKDSSVTSSVKHHGHGRRHRQAHRRARRYRVWRHFFH